MDQTALIDVRVLSEHGMPERHPSQDDPALVQPVEASRAGGLPIHRNQLCSCLVNGRLRFIVVLAVLTGSITTGEAQTGLYVQMDMGLGVAPPRIAESSNNA